MRRNAPSARAPALSGALVAVAALASGCKRAADSPAAGSGAAQPSPTAYSESFARGPVTFTLRLDRTEIGLAERVTLEEELRVEPGNDADFPEFLPEDFDGFAVVKIDDATPAPAVAPSVAAKAVGSAPQAAPDAASVRIKRLTLEPERSGDLTISPLVVFFRPRGAVDGAPAEAAEEAQVETSEVKVKVRGLDAGSAPELRPAPGLLPPPETPPHRLRLLLAAGGAAALALSGWTYWQLARRPSRPAPVIPPHEAAWEALRRLVARDLIGRGDFEGFFVELSAVLRRYVEDRFSVHAPERTTEEFLEEASRSAQLAQHRARLGEFLNLSDQVKFARFAPDIATVQSSFDTVKLFIAETTAATLPEAVTRVA